MAHPPRIPVQLPWGTSVVYFVTLSEKERRSAWANSTFFDAFLTTANRLTERGLWHIRAAVIMPDHLHLLATPLKNRDQSVGNLSGALKRWINKKFDKPSWEWQGGSFDRLLRANEQAEQKWNYMRENPVRAGLVERWEDWPWSIGIREAME